MKFIVIFLLVFSPSFSFCQSHLLPGKTWIVTEMNTIFGTHNIHLFHKDSSQNDIDLSPVAFRFFEDGTYRKHFQNDSSYIGHWSLNNTSDSAYIDSIPFKLIQLDSAHFITRGYSLQVVDNIGTMDTAFTYFKLGLKSVTLPVSLVSFNGVFNDNVIQLNWRTAQEINSHHFEILRGIDGKNFVEVGKVEAKGNSTLVSNYQYTDLQFSLGTNYYKLKIVDKDGSFSYSDIIIIIATGSTNSYVSIYPNPAKDQITITTQNPQHAHWQLGITNMNGQRVFNYSVPQNGQTRQMQLPGLPKGVYIITITDNKGKRIYMEKLLVR